MTRLHGYSLAAPLLACTLSCAPADDETPPPGVEIDHVLWMLDWYDPRHHPTWSITTPEGDVILVEDGWVVAYSASLVLCDPDPEERGHGDGVDPSATTDAVVESIVNVYPRVFEDISFPAQRYCSVHFAFGPASEELEGIDEADVGTSLRVQGTFFPANGDPGEPFDIVSTEAAGVLLPLDELEVDEPAALEIRIVRHFERAFEDVDPRDENVGLDVLRNLAAHAELEVRELDPGGA